MGANSIVAQPLTITGSIGVVAATFKLQEVYRRAGYAKTVISRGRHDLTLLCLFLKPDGMAGGMAEMLQQVAARLYSLFAAQSCSLIAVLLVRGLTYLLTVTVEGDEWALIWEAHPKCGTRDHEVCRRYPSHRSLPRNGSRALRNCAYAIIAGKGTFPY